MMRKLPQIIMTQQLLVYHKEFAKSGRVLFFLWHCFCFGVFVFVLEFLFLFWNCFCFILFQSTSKELELEKFCQNTSWPRHNHAKITPSLPPLVIRLPLLILRPPSPLPSLLLPPPPPTPPPSPFADALLKRFVRRWPA